MTSLLDKSYVDYQVCLLLLKNTDIDIRLDNAAYHIQQAFEKIIKHYISFKSGKHSFEHNIRYNLNQAYKLGLPLQSNLEDLADTLSKWESNTRYEGNFIASKEDIELAVIEYNKLYSLILELTSTLESRVKFILNSLSMDADNITDKILPLLPTVDLDDAGLEISVKAAINILGL